MTRIAIAGIALVLAAAGGVYVAFSGLPKGTPSAAGPAGPPPEARREDAPVADAGSLTGTWIKERARREDSRYPGDETWRLSVTFRPDGTFIWQSERKDAGSEPVDESLAGTYSVEGRTVTYRFEEPSPAARRALPGLFAWWPAPRVGKQRYRFEGDRLVLAFEGGKVWIHLRRGEP